MASAESPKGVAGFVILTLAFRKDGRRWLGECLELGTASYGRTLHQAHAELVELVELHLNTIEQVGERSRFFEEHRIQFYTGALPAEVAGELPVHDEMFVHAHTFPLAIAA